jgi:hypothetical protein
MMKVIIDNSIGDESNNYTHYNIHMIAYVSTWITKILLIVGAVSIRTGM